MIDNRRPLAIFLFPVFAFSPITPQSPPDRSPTTLRSNRASSYPPIFDALECMDMQTGLPLSGLINQFCKNSPLPQRLQTITLLQRYPFLLQLPLQCT